MGLYWIVSGEYIVLYVLAVCGNANTMSGVTITNYN